MSRTASTTVALPLPMTANLPPVSRLLVAAALTLATWENRRRTRIALQRLDQHRLADIGVTYRTALSESAKPFWLG